jgi:hypothetical protein
MDALTNHDKRDLISCDYMYSPGTFHLVNVARAEDLATSSLKHLAYQLHVIF